jgi:hypothetical protein
VSKRKFLFFFKKKGIYCSDSFYITQGVYNCSLYQLWKIYSFCSYPELQIGIMGIAQKTVRAVKIYCTDEKNTAAGGFKKSSSIAFIFLSFLLLYSTTNHVWPLASSACLTRLSPWYMASFNTAIIHFSTSYIFQSHFSTAHPSRSAEWQAFRVSRLNLRVFSCSIAVFLSGKKKHETWTFCNTSSLYCGQQDDTIVPWALCRCTLQKPI